MATEAEHATPTTPGTPATPETATPGAAPSATPSAEKKPARPAKALPPRRPWKAVPQKVSLPLTVAIIGATLAVVAVLLVLVLKIAEPPKGSDAPRLAAEFNDNLNNYSIRPPVNWHIEDPHDGVNIYIKGPREPGFLPLIVVCLDIKPGGIDYYLQEHKGRIMVQDKNTHWISQDVTDSIDGCTHTARLEYENELTTDDGKPVKVRTLQYILEDKPRFYRVSCHVASELFEKYRARFEASARSFRRLPIPKMQPKVIRD